MVERLTNLIGIFQKPELDFSKNRADNDDILGDAYEYLMRHFASESGKSKGQFYTPSEVSRIIAKVIGISPKNAVAATTAYDPTCGSGSLLLKVGRPGGKNPHHAGRAGKGRDHRGSCAHEHDLARLPDGEPSSRATLSRRPSSRMGRSFAPMTTSSPIRRFRTRHGAPACSRPRIPISVFRGASRRASRVTMPTCCISSAR